MSFGATFDSEEAVRALERENERIRQTNESASSRIRELEQSLRASEENERALREQLSEASTAKSAVGEMEKRLRELEGELSKQRAEVSRLEAIASERTDSLVEAKAKLAVELEKRATYEEQVLNIEKAVAVKTELESNLEVIKQQDQAFDGTLNLASSEAVQSDVRERIKKITNEDLRTAEIQILGEAITQEV